MKKKVYAYLHTHWDREWYRDKEDFNLRLIKVFDVVIDELLKNNAPFFYFDGQTSALLDYLAYREEKKAVIKRLIKEKKLAIGPYYVSADSYLVSYACMLKNLDFGLEISKEFNQEDYIGYMPDIFGISKSAFYALFEKKIDKALIWRGVNPKEINNNANFVYENIKTTWLVQGYFNDYLNQDVDSKQKAANLEILLDKINQFSNETKTLTPKVINNSNPLLLPIGADHLGILKNAANTIAQINSYLKKYEIILTSPFEYFKKSNYTNILNTPHFPKEFLNNFNTYILPGCYSSRIYQKTKNAILENRIARIVEILNYYLNYNYQKNIDHAYKTLIKCHAHDGICGCSIDSVHRTIDNRQEKVENILSSVEKNIVADYKKEKKITGKTKDKLGLFNLTNNSLNVVKIKTPYRIKNSQIVNKEQAFPDEIYYDIYQIPITEQITTLYTQLVEIEPNKNFGFSTCLIKKPIKKVKISENSIENDYVKLEVRNNKVRIIDKTKESISKVKKSADNIISFKLTDTKDSGDSYNYAPSGETVELELIKTKIIAQGSIQGILRLYYKNIYIDVILNNHSRYLKFNSTINNKTKNHKIQATFILDENINKTISQDAYGIIEREIDCNYRMQDYMPAPRPIELKTNSYPMQSFVNYKNNSILTKGLNEYEIYKKELRICLLRATSTISNPKNQARFVPAGPNLETIDSQSLCKTKQEFAFLFGNYKDCFNLLDEFFENYLAIDGEFKDNITIEFDKIKDNSYLYCINNNKKIIFDYANDINLDCRE